MHVWRAARDPKTSCLVHTVSSKHGHALLAPLVTFIFKVLRVSAAVWEHGEDWFPIHVEPNVTRFEQEHGVEQRRYEYNMSRAVQRPVVAKRDRSVRRALEYIDQHYTEPLRLEQVARLSGTTPKYFSVLFRKRESITFERYVFGLRIKRAKQLLRSTDLDVARVARLSGFNSPQYFCRAFRRALGSAPMEYRRRRDPAR